MLTNPDFKELLSILENYKVRYLVVGGYKENNGRAKDLIDAEKLIETD